MAERKKSRPKFSPEQKLAILHMRPFLDPEISITTLCTRVGVTPKTYYEWEKAYVTHGLEGLKPVVRKPYGDAGMHPQVMESILSLAQSRPYWSNNRLHNHLKNQGIQITRYALLRILDDHGLGTVESRMGATEKAIVKGDISPGTEELALLFGVNPCLADWYLMGERPRYPMGIDAISLGNKNPALRKHYLVLTIDYDSHYVCGLLAKARDYTTVKHFIQASQSLFSRPRGSLEGLFIFGDTPNSIISDSDLCEIKFRQESNKYFHNKCPGQSTGALQFITRKTIDEYLPKLKEVGSMQEAEAALAFWLDDHNNRPGSPMYPTFGRSPIDLLAVHSRPPVRSVPDELFIQNDARDFHVRKKRGAATQA